MKTIDNQRIKDILSKERYNEFDIYMKGKTVPNKEEVYEHDFLKWVNLYYY